MPFKLKFKIDKTKDVSSFFAFLEEAQYDAGRNFEWAVLKHHPYFIRFKMEGGFSVTKKVVQRYVDDYYLKNESRIKKNFIAFKASWAAKEKLFFELVRELFPKTNWPKGKYIAYSTMWSMYPRFVEDKTFQIPAITRNKKSIPLIIAHELLHFIFFSYFFSKYKKYKSHKYDFFVWHVSEIFNSIILRRVEWKELLEADNLDYPEHKKIIARLINYRQPVDVLVDRIIKEVEISMQKFKI